jgi:hypothetical protein
LFYSIVYVCGLFLFNWVYLFLYFFDCVWFVQVSLFVYLFYSIVYICGLFLFSFCLFVCSIFSIMVLAALPICVFLFNFVLGSVVYCVH